MAGRIVVLRDGEVVHDGAGESTEGVLDLMKEGRRVIKLAFKGLLARKLRTVLTGFAVVLGVAFVAGTFIFTDTIDASFKDLFERTSKGVDVSVQSKLAVEADFAAPPTMPADTLDRVQVRRRRRGGRRLRLGRRQPARPRRASRSSPSGPPTIAVTTGPERFDPLTYVEGGKPETDDQVAIDKGTADEYDFGVGDKVTVAGRAPAKTYTVSGVATLGDSENLAGSRLVVFTLPEGQRVTGHDGYDDISVAAAGGTSPEELKAAIARELGSEFAVRTGKEQAEKQAQDLSDALGFIRTALLVFAAVALLVGSFLIFNTFSRHGRPAHARVRAAAHARRLARADPALGGRRDDRHRHPRLAASASPAGCCWRPAWPR